MDDITYIPTTPEPFNETSYYQLSKAALSGNWNLVLKFYYSGKGVQINQKITPAGDTGLHLAVSGATEYTVLQLLEIVHEKQSPEETKMILGSRNKGGDTPLHLAAALGLDKVCLKMAAMWPEMVIEVRNDLNETPLLTAVRHGKRHAFFVLEAVIHRLQGLTSDTACLSQRDITHCRGHNGNNIIHYAIKEEQFDLAYEIIHLYPQLVNYFNSNGESALHILASMPSVFQSGTSFGLIDAIIYKLQDTEPLKLEFNDFMETYNFSTRILKKEILDEALPPTCKACVDLYSLIRCLINATFNTAASSLRSGICKTCLYADDEENQSGTNKGDVSKSSENQSQGRRIPPNCDVVFSFFKIIKKLLLLLLVVPWKGLRRLQTISKLKQKHRDAVEIMKQLVDQSTLWRYNYSSGGMKPFESSLMLFSAPPSTQPADSDLEDSNIMIAARGRDMLNKVFKKFSLEAKNVDNKDFLFIGMEKKESMNEPETGSPVLIAAKRGVTEMVKKILEKFPVAILDQDKDKKNIVLLAVEYRQVSVYTFMLEIPTMKQNVFAKVDKDGNSVLHLAASDNQPHTTTGAALQMQREIKWYKCVAASLDQEILATFNKEGKMAEEVFTKAHETEFKESREWLNNAANSFSVVAALIVTVAYMASSTVPGGFNNDSGFPIFQSYPGFKVFTLASLMALCFSVAALITFLGIIIRPYTIWDFEKVIPLKLLFGFTCSIVSIVAMLVSFCAGHSFTVEGQLQTSAYVLYGAMGVPVILSIKWLSNLYTSLLLTTFSKVPSFG